METLNGYLYLYVPWSHRICCVCVQLRYTERHVGGRLYSVRAVYTRPTFPRLDIQRARCQHHARKIRADFQVRSCDRFSPVIRWYNVLKPKFHGSGVTIGRARRAVHAGPALWGHKICPTLFFKFFGGEEGALLEYLHAGPLQPCYATVPREYFSRNILAGMSLTCHEETGRVG